MDASSLKSTLRSLLGDAPAEDGWEDAVLSEALTQGLADVNTWALPLEASYTATTSGSEHDLSSLSPLQIYAIVYPWSASAAPPYNSFVRWRLTGPGQICLEGVSVQAGEVLRVRFRKRWTVSGVGGETATTLGDHQTRLLLLAAASHAYLIRYRQLSRRPSTAPSDLAACKELATVYEKKFEAAVLGDASPLPAWVTIGL